MKGSWIRHSTAQVHNGNCPQVLYLQLPPVTAANDLDGIVGTGRERRFPYYNPSGARAFPRTLDLPRGLILLPPRQLAVLQKSNTTISNASATQNTVPLHHVLFYLIGSLTKFKVIPNSAA